ncbi:PREDICTED: uncharacterized protein LOC109153289 isoform X2 [Ipomoea nil]|uniref:uncharacterized protein LOC109153289 isoform X2 n=1 Tax=Ipomoea nil TaxID=35883 RepID=UPI000901A1C2|nr:PREDICTED: uncharacterized protein LOC109153289 isoform X2 [Ipomoea nil]
MESWRISCLSFLKDNLIGPEAASPRNRSTRIEVRNPSEALEILRMSRGGARGFDLVIAYAHKCQPNVTKLKNFIKSEFDQQLPIVCFKCIAVEGFDELNGMPACHLIDKWKSDTKRKECQLKWTEQLNFIFFLAVDSLSLRGDEVTAGRVLMCMKDIQQGLQLTERQVNSHLQKHRNFLSKSQRKNKLARDVEKFRKLQNENLADMGQAITAQMQFTTDIGSNAYYASQNPNMPMFDGQDYFTGDPNQQGVNGLSCPMSQSHNLPFRVIGGNNSSYPPYPTQSNEQQQFQASLVSNGGMQHNSSANYYLVNVTNTVVDNQLNIDHCPLTQQISNGFAMDNNYNGSVHTQPLQDYSLCGGPYAQDMASIAPWQQINSNSELHDVVGTSQQQSLNQHYSPQLDWRF